MKAKRPRGMRELTTIKSLSGRTVPHSREQIVAEQARLEHERARLERELAMWQENERRTSERLSGVLERLGLLAGASEQAAGVPPAAMPRRARSSGDPEEPKQDWHEIVIEY